MEGIATEAAWFELIWETDSERRTASGVALHQKRLSHEGCALFSATNNVRPSGSFRVSHPGSWVILTCDRVPLVT